MGIFDRKPEPNRARSAQERERARVEREARRAGMDPEEIVPDAAVVETSPPEGPATVTPAASTDPAGQQAPSAGSVDPPFATHAVEAPAAAPFTTGPNGASTTPAADPAEEVWEDDHDTAPRQDTAPRHDTAPRQDDQGWLEPDDTGSYDLPDDGGWVEPVVAPPPPPRRRGGRGSAAGAPKGGSSRRIAARIAAVGGLVLILAGLWFANALFQPFKGDGGSGGSIPVRVQRGSSVGTVATELAAKGVVSSAFFFKLRAELSGKQNDFKPGNYRLPADLSYGATITALTTGPPPPKTEKYTITEGRTRQEINRLLKKTTLKGSYLATTRKSKLLSPQRYGAPKSVKNLEGFLFPATYDIRVGATVGALVDQQLVTFKNRFSKIDLRKAKKKNLTGFDIVTIASLIEREAGVDAERPLIAAVMYNRLKQDISLGIDASVRYAVNNFDRPLKVSELDSDSPYNTRKFKGLPPGPIGNPGEASLRAAANPAKVDYLFYVVKPGTCGRHNFSATDAEFQKDVAAYDAARAKAGGKSPTTC